MNRLDSRLADLLDPVRDLTVSGLLEALARRLDEGAEVEHEPMIRDPNGRVIREGALSLPRRGDLLVRRKRTRRVERLETRETLSFAPITLIEPDGFVTDIAPFRWDAARIGAQGAQGAPNWAPLRRWFLEWFQSRYADVAPDLAGCVHSLRGPIAVEGGWEFLADFGSAPVECISDLIGAFVAAGVSNVRIGLAQD